ncbi:hypothetical protein W97_02356 [Coniosporium apollinis CBS 100218]|uniref:F-box domain-containing protein n=1 Tax=Coniosporium apollinis (strain CBS 100218) TaxID=1168221 RepID=R7YMV9_CONA1|nr:uncharacterized protein W97_02356 [Coniosporium apollinis CBS 100218]EON63129.1 hypothetical protein W97_02356 [Coniosporium apollinis CBS 100218]
MSCPISALLNPPPEPDPAPEASQTARAESEGSLPTASQTPQQPQFPTNRAASPTAFVQVVRNVPPLPQIVIADATSQRHKRAASTSAPSSPQDGDGNLVLRRKRAKLNPISIPPISSITGPLHGTENLSLRLPPIDLLNPQGTARSHPRHTPVRTPSRRFNLFTAFLLHPNDLLLHLCTHLRVPELFALYTISKPFHFIINLHLSTYMLACARAHAPESVVLFPFKCYGALCILDPIRRPHPIPSPWRRIPDRLVPGFKWLQMVVSRERAVEEILALLAVKGHRLPKPASETLKKIWMIMDTGTNRQRLSLIHNDRFFTNNDMICATITFMKLDMRFSDPVDGMGETAMRKMILGMRGLGERGLLGVLRGTFLRSRLEVLQWYVRQDWQDREAGHEHMSIFGVPPEEVGTACLERWTTRAVNGSGRQTSNESTDSQAETDAVNPQPARKRLLRPDQLVMGEGVLRNSGLHRYYLDAILYGYLDPQTLEEIPVPTVEETMAKLQLNDEEHGAFGPANPSRVFTGEGYLSEMLRRSRRGQQREDVDPSVSTPALYTDA